MKITDIADSFKDSSELQLTLAAQMKTLINLNKKIKQVQDENEHLKKLLTQTNPIVVSMDQQGMDEELISRSELRKLRQTSQERELSMEETKKVEIFSKILNTLANKPKAIEVTAKNMKSDELLTLLESSADDN